MSTLLAGTHVFVGPSGTIVRRNCSHGHVDGFGAYHFQPGASDVAAWPIAPHHRGTRGWLWWSEHGCRGEPIEEDHRSELEQAHWLVQAHWLAQARWLAQIRWCAWESETDAARVPGAGSRPIDSRSAKIPGHKGCESTNGPDLAPHLHRPARFQKTRDADTNPAHLWRKKQVRQVW